MKIGTRKKARNANQKVLKHTRFVFAILGLLFLTIFLVNSLSSFYWKDKTRIYYLDVGQGDACIISNNQQHFLVDGGGNRYMDEENNIGHRVLYPFLLDKNIRRIDIAFVSHLHYDHLKGILELLDCITIDKVAISYVYKSIIENPENKTENPLLTELLLKCKEKNTEIIYMKSGDMVDGTNIQFICHYPDENMIYQENENNNSMILELISHQTRVLFTGDIESEAEQWMLDKQINIGDIDILKVAHHGSITSSSAEFLTKIMPLVAIISVGKNTHGHPNPEIIERYKELKIPVYLTRDCGMIEVSIDSNRFVIKRFIKKDE